MKYLHVFVLSIIVIFSSNVFAKGDMKMNDLIPRKVLLGNPDKTAVKMSYDGTHISYVAPVNGVLNVWVGDINNIVAAAPITHDRSRGIREYAWMYDNKHIIYTQDHEGDENYRLYTYNIETKLSRLLTPERGVRAHLYAIDAKKPNIAIVGMNSRDAKFFDVYQLDILNDKLDLVFKNTKFESVEIDNDLKVRFASSLNENGDREIHLIKSYDQDSFDSELFMAIPYEDTSMSYLLSFLKDNSKVYMLDSRGRDTAALTLIDIHTKKSDVLFTSDKADVSPDSINPITHNLDIVSVCYDRKELYALSADIKDDLEYAKTVASGEMSIVSRALDDKTWIIAYDSDVGPVNYYKYNREKRKAEFLFANRNDLNKYKLMPMMPVVITSRDGLKLVSYLTLPDNYSKNNPVPLVLNVHGGPWARDYFGFSPLHQLLANRGYAVLSVNYRGSVGFGKQFANAGMLEWSGKMHDDLIDAVSWAIGEGITIKDKVAIYGGSYGGYAALVGLTFTPDVFACAVDVVGPSSLLTLINSVPEYWKPILSKFKRNLGPWDTEADIAALNKRSPLHYIDNIKRPLLIGHGANDPRVKQHESDQIVEAMKQKGVAVSYALYPDEGHGFARPENRMSFYALMEEFLSKYLGGDSEGIGDSLEKSTVVYNVFE